MHIAYIAFGSNIGNRQEYIKKAIEKLNENGMKIIKISKLYETEPYGFLEQENFINGVVKVKTEDSPQELLNKLMKIEIDLQRVRDVRWGPRTIDLDILCYDNIVIDTDNLKIPHIDMQNRRFVLEPFCDVEPDYIHPVLGKSIALLYKELLLR